MEPEAIERIRERLRKMSDLELRQYGRAARDLANPTLVRPILHSRFNWTRRERNGAGGILLNPVENMFTFR